MTYDSIVVGLGAMGSATLLHLARCGQRVLGIDRWDPPHAWGSTHGDTRITRQAIGEGEQYVPLVTRSHEIWRELEYETGEALFDPCGALILAPSGSQAVVHGKDNFVRRTIAAAERFAIPHEVLTPDECMHRYPQFCLQGDELVYFEPGGGYVRPEACVRAQLDAAKRAGAAVRTHTQVQSVTQDGAGVRVTTAGGDVFHAGHAVLSAGAWSPGLAPALAPRMQVLRQTLFWWVPRDPDAFIPGCCPVYIWVHGDGPEDSFYGFPTLPGTQGVKAGMEQYTAVIPDADQLERVILPGEAADMHRVHLAARMPGLTSEVIRSAVCPYTMTADGDFIVQPVPGQERVLLVSACSGHGFKHSAALGEAVARLVAQGQSADLLAFA